VDDDRVTFELMDEAAAGPGRRAAAGELLVAASGHRRRPQLHMRGVSVHLVRERGYILHLPAYRVLAWDGDRLVGTRMVCLPGCEPDLGLYGFGDVAVLPGRRRHGIAREMTRLAVAEAERRGADAMLTSTRRLEPLYAELGFRRVHGPEEVRLEVRGRTRFLPSWLIRWRVDPVGIVLRSEF
jgi:GNAT superfamily N-acetyltransferase